ncbi:hypothetical protein M9H77_34571 [Catharanthus roseus]|uniref:Uncharacterized protein n=1 Tax=Catharanthus roseus TaxID=4058 RepID=A0ACB9ZP29_CATRO|nr:hypothetical protein M9H77_34571 [Catharanthus roseus]
MASSSSSINVKVVLQSIHDKIFEIEEAAAKQSVMIEHLIEDRLTSSGPVIIPNVSGDILAKIIEYCKHMVTELPSGNHVCTIGCCRLPREKGNVSLTCEEVLYLIKRMDPVHIHRLFNIKPKFFPKDEERIRSANS